MIGPAARPWSRVDPTIDFDWGLGAPADGLGATNFSAAWQGVLEGQFDEPYTLHLVSDDGARLWLNGQKVIDAWYDHAAVEATAGVNLQAGHYYVVRVEYYQRTGEAVAKLLWSSPSTPKQPIPANAVVPALKTPRIRSLSRKPHRSAQPAQTAGGSASTDTGSAVPGASAVDTNALPPGHQHGHRHRGSRRCFHRESGPVVSGGDLRLLPGWPRLRRIPRQRASR